MINVFCGVHFTDEVPVFHNIVDDSTARPQHGTRVPV